MEVGSDDEPVDNKVNLKVRSRKQWGALPPKSTELLDLPMRYIYVNFTGHDHCFDRKSCKKTLQEYQREAMAQGHPDIPYNFLISGHGKIYEGRGWKVKVRRRDIEYYRDNQLAIGFIGDETTGSPMEADGVVSFRRILYYGMQHGYLIREPIIDDTHAITPY